MLFVRFDKAEIKVGQKSYNGFTGEQLNGLCAFAIEEEENLYLQVRNIAAKNSVYVNASEGHYVIFEGRIIEENFNKEGVVVEFYEQVERGVAVMGAYGYILK